MEKEQVLHSIPSLQINIKIVELIPENFLRSIHFHKEIELVWVKHGKASCIIGDDLLELHENQVLFINSKVFHRLSNCDVPGELTYIQIDINEHFRRLFPEFSDFMYLFVLNNASKPYALFDSQSEIYTLFHQIMAEGLNQTAHYNIALKSYINLLVTYMLRNNMIIHPEFFKDDKRITRILPAIEYINQNFTSKISLDDASAYANMDKYNLCKLFKQATGITFVEYVNFRRLLHSEELLLNSDKNITEIAFESGFMSIQYFNKVFKKILNCLPSAYRKAYAEIDYTLESLSSDSKK